MFWGKPTICTVIWVGWLVQENSSNSTWLSSSQAHLPSPVRLVPNRPHPFVRRTCSMNDVPLHAGPRLTPKKANWSYRNLSVRLAHETPPLARPRGCCTAVTPARPRPRRRHREAPRAFAVTTWCACGRRGGERSLEITKTRDSGHVQL